MNNRFMKRHSHEPAEGGSGFGCSPVDCEYRDQCDRTGEHCRHHGGRRGSEAGHDLVPHGPGDGRGSGEHGWRRHEEETGPGPHGPHGPHDHHGRSWHPGFPEDDSLRSLLIRAAQSMHHPRAGASQELVLRILDREGELDQRVLRQELQIQPGSLSELLGKLEQKGLIGRDRVESDRRRVTVRLTEAGRAALSPGEAAADDPFAALNGEEQTVLRSLLEKLLSVEPET